MASTDVERLQPGPEKRSRCLDVFLLGSVITLFVMVLSGAALVFWMVHELRAEMKRALSLPDSIAHARLNSPEAPPNFNYKWQNFAYFTANSSQLKNGSMEWAPIKVTDRNTVGSRYSYDTNHHALKMLHEGTYFLYTQLNLSCIGPCATGSLTVTFEDSRQKELLSCSLHLTHPGPSVRKCWAVIPHVQKGHRLMAHMYTNVPPQGWKLDLNHSGFGMFLVDEPGTEKEGDGTLGVK